jgi:hypothetical protein
MKEKQLVFHSSYLLHHIFFILSILSILLILCRAISVYGTSTCPALTSRLSVCALSVPIRMP